MENGQENEKFSILSKKKPATIPSFQNDIRREINVQIFHLNLVQGHREVMN